MQRLIDANKLLEPGYTDMFDAPIRFAMVSRYAIETAPTVKAIPVEWIENYISKMKDDGMIYLSSAGSIKDMIKEWEKENEESLAE